MAAKYSDDIIQEVIRANDLVSIAREYLDLKKTGKNYKALCPFHNEKTPSFVISEDKQLYHCFGCGASGNVIHFIMNMEKLDFVDALEFLAEKGNINFQREKATDDSQRTINELYRINREAAIFFYRNLWKDNKNNREIISYLKNRGLKKEVIIKFGLGYAPNSWEGLMDYLLKKKFPLELIHKSGLIIQRNDKTGYYDRFRNRIIFPIFNVRGKIVGFGGRVLDDSKPKYLNSPETSIFSKSNILYGLNFAKNEISENKRLILVEGYMDVISLYQYGIKNVVASLGTALTKQHGDILKRYADEILIAYDSDSAGQSATIRGLDILGEAGCKVRVVTLEDDLDPDEFIRKYGVDVFKEKLENSLSLIDYKISLIKKEYDIKTDEGKLNFIKNSIEILKSIKSPVEQDIYINKISSDVGISPDVIKQEIQGNNREKIVLEKQKFIQKRDKEINPVKLVEKNGVIEIQKNIIYLCLISKNTYMKISQLISSKDFINEEFRNAYGAIEKIYMEKQEIDMEYVIDNFDLDIAQTLKEISDIRISYEDIDKTIDEFINNLKKFNLKKEINLIKDRIKELESKEKKEERDVKEINRLCVYLMELNKRIAEESY